MGDDERDLQLFEPRDQGCQVTERRGVCPVRVIDHSPARRACCGEVRAQPVEAVEDREGRSRRPWKGVPL